MFISPFIRLAQEYLLTGVILVLVIVGLFLLYHFTIGRHREKEHKKINVKRLLWWFVFLCYIFLVFSATMFNRSTGLYDQKVVNPLFYSYRSAWNGWVKSEWRNILLNYVMFVPFGLLLPVGIKFFRKFYKTALAGFLFSLFIEVTQRIFSFGIFEPDDLLDNTLGAVIGYGLFMIAFFAYSRIRQGEPVKVSHVVLTNVPLVLILAAFFTIWLVYHGKELGNNNNRYILPYKKSLLNITGAGFTDESVTSLPVYMCDTIDADEALRRAPEIFKQLGKGDTISLPNYYDEIAVFWTGGKNASLWIKYHGATYDYTNYNNMFNEAVEFDKEEVRDILLSYGYGIVEDAPVSVNSDHRYNFKINMVEYEGTLWDGQVKVTVCEDKTIKALNFNAIELSLYKNFDAISEAEAYRQLKEGCFKRSGSDFLDIEILTCKIVYALDTKGFYQPNYRFEVNINGKEAWIMIPALIQK